jgi:integrase
MARPQLPIGAHGEITYNMAASGAVIARTNYRDADGKTRQVQRTGRTQAAARNSLLSSLQDRRSVSSGSRLSADSPFRDAAELWLAGVVREADTGELSPNTAQLYGLQLRNHVLPALGSLRLREVGVARVDDFLRRVQRTSGVATAKTCRTVISGVMGLAVRYELVPTNPTRETSRIRGGRRKAPRALTRDERARWLAALEADPQAVRKDLPDLTRWMLATGVRIGEALAVSWLEVDLDARSVEVDWKLIRIKGDGLLRVPRVKDDSDRTLPLPPLAVDMLRRRRLGAGPYDPVFPDSAGGWRDPSNTSRDLRTARGTAGFSWVTSHVFRKTCATILDEAGMSARDIADQLGHARPSMTQDVYMGRKIVNPATAAALEAALSPTAEK